MFNLSLPEFLNPNNIFDISIEVDNDKAKFYYLLFFITNILGTYTYFTIKDKYFGGHKKEIDKLVNTINEQKKELEIKEKDLIAKQTTIQNLENDITHKNEKINNQHNKIEKIKNRYYELSSKLQELQTIYTILKEKHIKTQEDNISLKTTNEKLLNDIKVYNWYSTTKK